MGRLGGGLALALACACTSFASPSSTSTSSGTNEACVSPAHDVDLSTLVATAHDAAFCLTGIYVLDEPIVPRDGQRFLGPATIVGRRADRAFTGSARDVLLRDLEIRGFDTPVQKAAVDAKEGVGWVMERLEVHRNASVGVTLGTDCVLRDSHIHHNGQLGVKGHGARGLVEGNEIAFNNHREDHSWGWEAGGSKFWKTSGYVVRDNHWHHNAGPGIWFDTDNSDALIEGNLVEDNYDNGIFYEVSSDAVIRDNVVRRNGARRAYGWLNGAGIFISASGNVRVIGNTVRDNVNGIALQQQDRGAGYVVRNVLVRDNLVAMGDGARTGLVEDVDGDAPLRRNNVFERNRYELSGDAGFAYGSDLTWKQWRARFPTERMVWARA